MIILKSLVDIQRVQKRFVNLAIWSILVLIAKVSGDIPGCDYFDTVDLTNSHPFENGSYLYDGILIPKEMVGKYTKEIFFDGDEQDVLEHIRGCVCQDKPCIRMCCPLGQVLVKRERKCKNASNLVKSETFFNITLKNGTSVKKDIQEYALLKDLPIPCEKHLFLSTDWDATHNWTLFENGTLIRHKDSAFLSKRDYCMNSELLQDGTSVIYKIIPHHCIEEADRSTDIVQVVSVFFMILITVVYLILPNFRSVHGKCCTCYFICLSMAFSFLVVANLHWVEPDDGILICYFVGCVGYIAVLSSFLWLLIINYNLWKTFQNVGVGIKNRFLKYNIFVWSVASVLFAFTTLTEFTEYTEYIPGFTHYDCWINTYSWTASIYFYGPLLTLITINIVLFIKTAMRIIVQNRDNRRQLKQSESQCQLRNLANFVMLLRLFVIVGVVWILEIITYVCSLYGIRNNWTKAADYITCSQGIILFVVTILKKDVLKALAERLKWKSQKQTSLTVYDT